ncbi:MAG: hypothetical protein FWE57_04735 [Chitinispirillia bacterium]|nr:hypothetical protein [Chitinispirillia bacterium]
MDIFLQENRLRVLIDSRGDNKNHLKNGGGGLDKQELACVCFVLGIGVGFRCVGYAIAVYAVYTVKNVRSIIITGVNIIIKMAYTFGLRNIEEFLIQLTVNIAAITTNPAALTREVNFFMRYPILVFVHS